MKELKKRLNKKGFTLAELLIVVAIIAIMVAVSIPIFTSKLEKAREATDIANMRAAKAAAVTAYLSEDEDLGFDKEIAATASYTAFYNADKGVLEPAVTGIEAYGQGTAKDAKQTYSGYYSKADYKQSIIKIRVDSDGKEVHVVWVKPSNTDQEFPSKP